MNNLNQNNQITLTDIKTRTELWKDKIYFIPDWTLYWTSDLYIIPTPNKFADLVRQFRTEIKEQKEKQVEADQAIQQIQELKNRLLEYLKDQQINILPLNYQKWKNISLGFTNQLIQKWVDNHFTYETCKEWIDIGLKPKDADFCVWLRDILHTNPDQLLNNSSYNIKDLREQFAEYRNSSQAEPQQQEQQQLKELKILKQILEQGSKEQQWQYLNKLVNKDDCPHQIQQIHQQWETLKDQAQNFNACYILNQSEKSLTFTFQPPNKFFSPLQYYLFNYLNQWYEVESWERINHQNALIKAKLSPLVNFYQRFFLGGMTGIAHTAPGKMGISSQRQDGEEVFLSDFFQRQDEICQCPNFLEGTKIANYYSTWQPKYSLWKVNPETMFSGVEGFKLYGRRDYNSSPGSDNQEEVGQAFHTYHLTPIANIADLEKDMFDSIYYLLPKDYCQGREGKFITTEKLDWKRMLPPNQNREREELGNKEETIQETFANIRDDKGNLLNIDLTKSQFYHLQNHITVQFFYNRKPVHQCKLNEIDLGDMSVEIMANPARIMYNFRSGKVFFPFSELCSLTLDASQAAKWLSMLGNAVQGVPLGLGKIVKAVTDGREQQFASISTIKETFQGDTKTKDDRGGQEEGQGKRKTSMANTSQLTSVNMGVIPSVLHPSHIKNDYSLADFLLRYRSPNFEIRLEYNYNTIQRYCDQQKIKGMNGNKWFSEERIGSKLNRSGYYKLVPTFIEKDYEGFFASIFSQGVYLYETSLKEPFMIKLERLAIADNIIKPTLVGSYTSREETIAESSASDNHTDEDGRSWIGMRSYIRKVGSSENLISKLIDQRPKSGVASTLTRDKQRCINENNEIFTPDGDSLSSYTHHIEGRPRQGYYTYIFYDFVSQSASRSTSQQCNTYGSRAAGTETYDTYTTTGNKYKESVKTGTETRTKYESYVTGSYTDTTYYYRVVPSGSGSEPRANYQNTWGSPSGGEITWTTPTTTLKGVYTSTYHETQSYVKQEEGYWRFHLTQWESNPGVVIEKGSKYEAQVFVFDGKGQPIQVLKEEQETDEGEWYVKLRQDGATWTISFTGINVVEQIIGDASQIGGNMDYTNPLSGETSPLADPLGEEAENTDWLDPDVNPEIDVGDIFGGGEPEVPLEPEQPEPETVGEVEVEEPEETEPTESEVPEIEVPEVESEGDLNQEPDRPEPEAPENDIPDINVGDDDDAD